jgi:DNA-binding CsgD family transcriptional regulator
MQANNNNKAHSLDPVSSLLLQIYRAARELPVEQFQDAVLKQLQPFLAFDSTWWGTGMYEGANAVVHSFHLTEQPAEMIENWQLVSHEDVVAHAVAANPGRTVNAHAPTLLRDKPASAIREHTQRYRLANCLVSSAQSRGMPVLNWLSLFREHPDRQFSEADRVLYQGLFPHIVEALTINRLIHLDSMYTTRQSGRAPVAIVDRKGFIYNSDGGFEQTLRAEWPAWSARVLPQPLIQEIVAHPIAHYRGNAIHVASQRVGDLYFLKARELGAVDRLTRREKQIAERFAQGLSHKEIAKLLELAPATVRNYIQTIYGKLGVRDKAALANLMVKSE